MLSLKQYNTFGINAAASEIIEISGVKVLQNLINIGRLSQHPFLILGGGSNILFTQDYSGLVLLNRLKGIALVDENEEHIFVKAAGGEIWHDLVMYCVNKQYAGIENLSLIPGTVGAAPIQNIGAYGVELKDVFHSLEAINLSNGALEVFEKAQCNFGYRESVFKQDLKGKYFITSVTFKLNKKAILSTHYGDINKQLDEWGITNPQIKDISNAVIHIRQSKLPDPAEIGNAGSFFKNPVLPELEFNSILQEFPEIRSFTDKPGFVKISAAWLIEQSGWKGYREGDIGVHQKQALVLVNYGNGTGQQLINLANKIIESVFQKFKIRLHAEVNII